MPEETEKDISIASRIPNFYYDLIARIIPGAVAFESYAAWLKFADSELLNAGIIIIFVYLIGMILNIFSVDSWYWLFYNRKFISGLFWNGRLVHFRDSEIWDWIRYELSPGNRDVFIKMLAEYLMFKSLTIIAVAWLIYPPHLFISHIIYSRIFCFALFAIFFYYSLRTNLRLIRNKEAYIISKGNNNLQNAEDKNENSTLKNRPMKQKSMIIILAFTVILISLGVYYYYFKNSVISEDTSKWGAFSDYLNPFVGIANLIIIIWLAIAVYNYNEKRDSQNDEFQRTLERPIIIFKRVEQGTNDRQQPTFIWIAKNIGKGAALNIKVSETKKPDEAWSHPLVKCYSLESSGEVKLPWLKTANVLVAFYTDIHNVEYVTLGADSLSFTEQLSEYNTIRVREFDYTLELINAINGYRDVKSMNDML